MKFEELESLYKAAENIDNPVFAEQRSNVLLAASEHYNRRNTSKYWARIRDNQGLSEHQKIRITKNHIQKITKSYINNLLTYCPGVRVLPKTDSELQDVKAAELSNSILSDIKTKHKTQDKIRSWAKDFVEIGEVYVKLFWDPMKGTFLGHQQEVDENGAPVVDEMGQPSKDDKKPLFTGDFVFERVYGFNLLRCPTAKSMHESPYLITRKMVGMKDMEARLAGDEEKLKLLDEGRDETYLIFDNAQSGYSSNKDDGQMLLKEYYFRPCPEYPQGYFFITSNKGVLWEGELPFGIFPIQHVGFDDMQTSARSSSIIKVARPYQANINRKASHQVENEMIMGQDKIVYQAGSKITNGAFLPGVRAYAVSGPAPTVIPGRTGDQYLAGMEAEIDEMYKVCNIFEDAEEKPDQDPLLALFKNLRQKKKFVIYAEKFEQFLVDVFETALEMAKQYYTEDMLIPVIGKKEYVNISEFKNTDKLCYEVKVEAMVDDLDTMMGKQLTFQHILQYAGSNLTPQQIGVISRNMPYANEDQALKDLTQDYDNSVNDILSLDRGVPVQANRYDDHPYIIKRLISRMKDPDFKFLSPQIQQLYQQTINDHEQMQSQIAQQLKAAEAEFIPSGGYLVVCDFYVPDPKNPGKTQRVRVPSEAMSWLLDKLDQQGSGQEALEPLQEGAKGDIANMVTSQGQQAPSPDQGQTPQQPGGMSAQDQALAGMLQHGK